jgi:hypothetical protein
VEGQKAANLNRRELQFSGKMLRLLLLTHESQAPEGNFADYFLGFLHNE